MRSLVFAACSEIAATARSRMARSDGVMAGCYAPTRTRSLYGGVHPHLAWPIGRDVEQNTLAHRRGLPRPSFGSPHRQLHHPVRPDLRVVQPEVLGRAGRIKEPIPPPNTTGM